MRGERETTNNNLTKTDTPNNYKKNDNKTNTNKR